MAGCAAVHAKKEEVKEDASSCIRMNDTDSTIKWHTDGKPAIVELNLAYQNVCKQALTCKVSVAIGIIDRGSNASELVGWKVHQQKDFDVTLPPDTQASVEVTLPWISSAQTVPALRFAQPPGKDMDMLQCSKGL